MRNKCTQFAIASIAMVLAMGVPQEALAQVIVSDGSPAGNRDNWTGTVGTQFTIGATDVSVDALGFEDAGGDGLSQSHQVGLWRADGTLVVSVTVPAGSSATLHDTWRYEPIGSTVTLQAGQTYVLGAQTASGSGDPFTDTTTLPQDFTLGTGILDANPTNVFKGGAFGFPNLDGGNADLRWAPANATFAGNLGSGPGCSAIEGVDATALQAGYFFVGRIGAPGVSGVNKKGKPVDNSDSDALTDSMEACINDALMGHCTWLFYNDTNISITPGATEGNKNQQQWFTATFDDVGGCYVTECSDRADNDPAANDGIDFPFDPDCDDWGDDRESPITGACCAASDSSCSVVTEATCSGGGDSYQGDDTTCEPFDPCIAVSDFRLKRDIAHVAELDNGIRLYSFKYLWSDVSYVGVMAQDLLLDQTHHKAVIMMENGFYAVDYARLGMKMMTLDEWRESQ